MNDRHVRDALRMIAASSLRCVNEPLRLDHDDVERELLDAVSRERLTGLAIAAIRREELELSPRAVDDLCNRHEDQLALDLRLERLLLETATTLEHAQIPYRALKGPVLAHTVYGDPALRSFGDIDILVPGNRFDPAIDALRTLGFDRRFAEPRPGFDARFSKGACLERADGLEVDLHRTLAPGAFGLRLAGADLFARAPEYIELGGATVAGVDRETAFVHACFHAALGDSPPRLVPVRDVAVISASGFDASVVMKLAGSVRCESVFQRAIGLVDAELGIHLDGEFAQWARAYTPNRLERWALAGYSRPDRSYATQIAASLAVLPSVRERASYAAALAFPTRNYLRARERGYARRLTHGARILQESRPR